MREVRMSDVEVCVPNIGARERRKRRIGGLVLAGVALGLAAWLLNVDAPRVWRLVVVLPALGAALGFFQARSQTCVALAARGTMNLDAGDLAVGDATLLLRMRRQSRRVLVQSATAAVVFTVAVLVI